MTQIVNGWRSSLTLIGSLALFAGTAHALEENRAPKQLVTETGKAIQAAGSDARVAAPILSQYINVDAVAFSAHLPEAISGPDRLVGNLDGDLAPVGWMVNDRPHIESLLRSTVLVKSGDVAGIRATLSQGGLGVDDGDNAGTVQVNASETMPWWTIVECGSVREALKVVEILHATESYNRAAIDRILGSRSHHIPGLGQQAAVTQAQAAVMGQQAAEDGAVSGLPTPDTRGTSAIPNDPRFANQWYLQNTIQDDQDINAPEAWEVATGQGVVIGILDAGQYGFDATYTDLQLEDSSQLHDDLVNNYRADLSQAQIPFPFPIPPAIQIGDFVRHSLALAGIVAAEGNNNLGIVGVAYNAEVAGLRNGGFQQTGEAIAWRNDEIDIKLHAWGNTEDGQTSYTGGTGILFDFVDDSIRDSIVFGRDGLGVIHVAAAGNSGVFRMIDETETGFFDSIEGRTDVDEFRSSRFVIAVGAAQEDQAVRAMILPEYASTGASILVAAPSGADPTTASTGAGRGLDVLDINATTLDSIYSGPVFGDASDDLLQPFAFEGTSASAAITAGVVALMLEANPGLTWRDVQHILVETADPFAVGFLGFTTELPGIPHPFLDGGNPFDGLVPFRFNRSAWQINGGGRPVSDGFGFGLIDAQAAVEAAATWSNVPDEFTLVSQVILEETEVPNAVSLEVPDSDPPALLDVAFTPVPLTTACVRQNIYVESVEVQMSIESARQGDLHVELTSPSGTRSVLKKGMTYGGLIFADTRPDFPFPIGADSGGEFRFTTKKHWGESSGGTWNIAVADMLGEPCCGDPEIDCDAFGWCDGEYTITSWRLLVYGYETGRPTFPCPVFFTECGADINADGVVDVRDILLFLELWNQGFAFADINEDGFVDRDDFLAFYNIWITSLGLCDGLTDQNGLPNGQNTGTIGPPVVEG